MTRAELIQQERYLIARLEEVKTELAKVLTTRAELDNELHRVQGLLWLMRKNNRY